MSPFLMGVVGAIHFYCAVRVSMAGDLPFGLMLLAWGIGDVAAVWMAMRAGA